MGKLTKSAGGADPPLLPTPCPVPGPPCPPATPQRPPAPFPPRQTLGAGGLNPADSLTLGTCCLLLSTSCLTQLSTARYTSSSDGTLRLSLEMRSSTCREGRKRQVSAGAAQEQGIYPHRQASGQRNSAGRGREQPPAGAGGRGVHGHWRKDPQGSWVPAGRRVQLPLLAARVRSQLCPRPPSLACSPPAFCV